MSELHGELKCSGRDALWAWFSLSRATWLTLPRSMMHEMPDDWQRRMADLLTEWGETWNSSTMPDPHVAAKTGGKFTRWPEWLLNYRHPNREAIASLRVDGKIGADFAQSHAAQWDDFEHKMTPLDERMPHFGEGLRVLIYTDGVDFAGQQFFDVAADTIDESSYEDPGDMPEECRAATHWMALPYPV